DPEGEEHGHQLYGAGVDREAKEASAGLRHIDESDQRAIDESLDEQRDEEGRLLDGAPDTGAGPEDLECRDGGAEDEPVNGPDGGSEPGAAPRREVEEHAVDASDGRAADHDTHQEPESPPGPDSHGAGPGATPSRGSGSGRAVRHPTSGVARC